MAIESRDVKPVPHKRESEMLKLAATLVLVSLIAGCAGPKELHEAESAEIPKWYTNPPQDDDYLTEAATATSQDMQMSVDAALVAARAGIARQVEVKMTATQKRLQDEVAPDAALTQRFKQTITSIVSESLTGSRVRHQEVSRDGSIWRAYVLAEYPVGAANQALMQRLQASNEMSTRLRSSEAWKELEAEVVAYEEWKDSQ